jgi:hypothetical protein
MDGLKVGEIEISALGPHVHHAEQKLKKRQIDKKIELDRTKRRNVHKNERIKESQ